MRIYPLSATEKLYALAHEVGHIFCGHLKDGNMRCSVEEEYKANEFAHMLLPPSFPSKVLRWSEEHKKPLLSVLLSYWCLYIGVIGIAYVLQQQSYMANITLRTLDTNIKKRMYILKGKNNVERLTQEQYYSGAYEPCQICFPEDH